MSKIQELRNELIKEHESLKEKIVKGDYTQYQLGYACCLNNIIKQLEVI
jgi:hypothetical protein